MNGREAVPSVGVVVPTRDRPALLRETLASIAAQDYPGHLEVVVVHDGTEPDQSVAVDGERPVRVVANDRAPGLAGARNTGIMALRTEFVAFCDDDDTWSADKLSRQLARATLERDRTGSWPELVSTSIEVDFEGRRTARLAGTEAVTHAHLTRSRMSMLHSSTLVFSREALVDPERIGLVDEQVPGSQNEDWDILLRAAERHPIAHVDEPLVRVRWGRSSMFARSWDTKVSSLAWMLERHPAIGADRRGAARVYGQIAFGEAARGDRRAARTWARRALAADPRQWRAVPALLVSTGAVRAESVLHLLHRFGRGV